MAIFYNHIKGCGYGTAGQPESTSDVWSWIRWSSASALGNNNTTINENDRYRCWVPSLYIGKENNFATAVDYGYLITSRAKGQEIDERIDFKTSIYAPIIYMNPDYNNDANIIYIKDDNILSIKATPNDEDPGHIQIEGEDIILYSNKAIISDIVTIDKKANFELETQGSSKIKHSLYVGLDKDNVFDPANQKEGTIKAEYKCEALYFNATSDNRAKSNITPAEFSALSVVKNLPVYTFQYLNSEESVIGLIAQEAAEFNLDGFNMVDNLTATGEKDDFMQMKESKLVYVLWKAVQELSAEVEELKTQIASLK